MRALSAYGGSGMKIETVLVVDDDALVLRALARHLQGAGKQAVTTVDPQQARELSRSHRPELAIVDLLLGPEGVQGGLTLVHHLRDERGELVIVAYSGAMTLDLMTFAIEAGADRVVRKDFTMLRGLLGRLESGEQPLADMPPSIP